MDLRQDGLEIAVPNDFISEWIGKNFTRPIQEAAHEVLGGPLAVRFCVVPELFEVEGAASGAPKVSDVTLANGIAGGGGGKTAGSVKIAGTARGTALRTDPHDGGATLAARTVAIVPRPATMFGAGMGGGGASPNGGGNSNAPSV